MKRILPCVFAGLLIYGSRAQTVLLPDKPNAFRFAVVGDTGTGGRPEYEIAQRLADYRKQFPFTVVLMVGDNIYGGYKTKDLENKFELPYKSLLNAGVRFYAALGNHDNPNERFLGPFNMGGNRYYDFSPAEGIRFFALDSNNMDAPQVQWFEKEAAAAHEPWKIAYFHHPLYSSGKTHGSDLKLRAVLEPLFLKYGVSLVISGHDHIYERIKPQNGIHYFVEGGSAHVRRGDARRTDIVADAFDSDDSFMLMEIDKDELEFEVIARGGESVDAGSFQARIPVSAD